MGLACPPVYGKSKFYINKREKLLKKIEKLKEKVKVCDEKIAKESV